MKAKLKLEIILLDIVIFKKEIFISLLENRSKESHIAWRMDKQVL